MSKQKLIIGTRGSALALWQSYWVRDALQAAVDGLDIELVKIETKGDKILDQALAKIGDKGLFTKDIELQLLDGRVDLAVHSLKDMPTTVPEGLKIAAISNRYDPADVLVSKDNVPLEQLKQGAIVLTSSLRRRAQLLHHRPDLQIEDVRGNVQTRLRKLDESDASAMVLAGAGLRRLELEDRISQRLDPMRFLPACGQGALAIEIRENDPETEALVLKLDDEAGRITSIAERTVLAELHGGCQVPLGAYAVLDGDTLKVIGIVSDLEGKQLLRAEAAGSKSEPEKVGLEVANELLAKGGQAILDAILSETDR